MTLALNHLSYFLLTNLLLDVLADSVPARVINVSSNGHFNAGLDFDDLQLEKGYSALKAYKRSKFANVLFSYELSRRTEGIGITSNVLHPGLVKSDIGKSVGWMMGYAWRMITFFNKGLTPTQGAQTSVYLASSPAVDLVTGKYFAKQQAIPSDPATYDKAAAMRLWELSSALVGFD